MNSNMPTEVMPSAPLGQLPPNQLRLPPVETDHKKIDRYLGYNLSVGIEHINTARVPVARPKKRAFNPPARIKRQSDKHLQIALVIVCLLLLIALVICIFLLGYMAGAAHLHLH